MGQPKRTSAVEFDDALAVLVDELDRRWVIEQKQHAFTDKFLFQEQKCFVADLAKRVVALASRRAGKTTATAWKMVNTAQRKPGCQILYMAVTIGRAKAILWNDLVNYLDQWGMDYELNLGDLIVKFPNGSQIEFGGCLNESDTHRYRGRRFALVVIDECQSFAHHLEVLLKESIGPTMKDDPTSQLYLLGTPPARKAGPWYTLITNAKAGIGSSFHHWTFTSNLPFLKGRDPEAIIAEAAAEHGLPITAPFILREYRGQVIDDLTSLVFPLTAGNNQPLPDEFDYVGVGVDIGFTDPTAIVVLGAKGVKLYELYSFSKAGLLIPQIKTLLYEVKKRFNPDFWVADCGGGTKTTVESLNADMGDIYLEAAIKQGKIPACEMLADAVRRHEFVTLPDSPLAAEWATLEWSYTTSGQKKFPDSLRFDETAEDGQAQCSHYDRTHGALYIYRKLQPLLVRPEVKPEPVPEEQLLRPINTKQGDYFGDLWAPPRADLWG